MSTESGIMRLKEDTILKNLIVRRKNARCTRYIYAIAAETTIDGTSI